jgi:predicted SprT family Zn-dependent metalloprotease
MSNNAETINKMLQNYAEKSNIEKVRAEVDAAYDEGPSWMHEVLPRDTVHEFLAPRFKSKHGQCQYNRRKPNSNVSATGHHVIRIAPSIITSEHDWRDTVRHELAHALAYERWGSSQGHNTNWKSVCREIGAEPTRCASKHHTARPYRFACPNGCWEVGKLKRSKKIKYPWERFCKHCGEACVSWDADDAMPEEPGVCEVSSIEWRTKGECD